MPLNLDEHMEKKAAAAAAARSTANSLMLETAMHVYAGIISQYDIGAITDELCTEAAAKAIQSAPAFAIAAGVVRFKPDDGGSNP